MQKAGRRLRTEHLEVRVSDSLLSHARAQVIVGKHGHNIVERNRLRRRLRELSRLHILPAVGTVDVVTRANASAYDVDFDQLRIEVEQIVQMLLRKKSKE